MPGTECLPIESPFIKRKTGEKLAKYPFAKISILSVFCSEKMLTDLPLTKLWQKFKRTGSENIARISKGKTSFLLWLSNSFFQKKTIVSIKRGTQTLPP